jgi:hypothetical protein
VSWLMGFAIAAGYEGGLDLGLARLQSPPQGTRPLHISG